MIKILAISGSTRKSSSNLTLIGAIKNLTADIYSITIYEELSQLPHFNPDLDNDNAPEQVKAFRQQLRETDGILICTPEYAVGVPGTLKNAIDWTVSSMEFSQRPVALITASTSGLNAHRSLLGTLLIIESRITKDTQLVISSINTKVTGHEITDTETLSNIKKLIKAFTDLIESGNISTDKQLKPPSFY